MSGIYTHTDLALEARESIEYCTDGINGVSVSERVENRQRITKVIIEKPNAAKAIGKPMGTYITIEAGDLSEKMESEQSVIANCIAKELSGLVQDEIRQSKGDILIVGLGNREVTPDALGPSVIDRLHVTRHILNHYGKRAYADPEVSKVCCVEPGVMAKTGMEAAEIVLGVVRETKPNLVVVIDALAARSTKRLNHTVQITNTGIQPGSGVANHRSPLTKESLGVPVIAIGVPTVIDGETFVRDALDKICKNPELRSALLFGRGKETELELHNMYLTGKDVDDTVRNVSCTLADGINQAFHLEEKPW